MLDVLRGGQMKYIVGSRIAMLNCYYIILIFLLLTIVDSFLNADTIKKHDNIHSAPSSPE